VSAFPFFVEHNRLSVCITFDVNLSYISDDALR